MYSIEYYSYCFCFVPLSFFSFDGNTNFDKLFNATIPRNKKLEIENRLCAFFIAFLFYCFACVNTKFFGDCMSLSEGKRERERGRTESTITRTYKFAPILTKTHCVLTALAIKYTQTTDTLSTFHFFCFLLDIDRMPRNLNAQKSYSHRFYIVIFKWRIFFQRSEKQFCISNTHTHSLNIWWNLKLQRMFNRQNNSNNIKVLFISHLFSSFILFSFFSTHICYSYILSGLIALPKQQQQQQQREYEKWTNLFPNGFKRSRWIILLFENHISSCI